MEKTWETKATLYELLARTFLFTKREVTDALVSGEYADALDELLADNGVQLGSGEGAESALACYRGGQEDEVFHAIRKEYTRLYIGSTNALVIPYSGTSDAAKRGQKPLLFVGKKSMAVERFMRKCGIVHVGESNDPLDHIGTMLEFLMHLCMIKAGLVEAPAGVEVPETAYEEFYTEHFIGFARSFAEETIEKSDKAFFTVGARVLDALPDNPL